MLPAIAYGIAAAAALLVAACNQKTKEEPAPKPGPPSPAGPGVETTTPSAVLFPPPPAPPPFYLVFFGNDLRASAAYLKLKAQGATDEAMDQGCPWTQDRLTGKGDRRIETCEIHQYALDNSKKYPEAASALVGETLPWSFNDYDSKTDADEKLRARVAEAVLKLKESEALKKLPPASKEYREKLAVGMLYFTDFPGGAAAIRAKKKPLLERTAKLVELGLKDFQDYLFQKGGLGAYEIKSDVKGAPHESALTTTKLKKASDLSKANLLYAVFFEAGLNPRFVSVERKEVDPKNPVEIHPGAVNVYKSVYYLVGLELGMNNYFFDLDRMKYRNDFKDPSLHFLGDYYGIFLHAQGVENIRIGKFERGVSLQRRSISIDPLNPSNYLALGKGLEETGNINEAELALREALRQSPKYAFAHYNLADLLLERRKDVEGALQHFLLALQSPDWNPMYDKSGQIKKVAKNYEKKFPIAKQLSIELEKQEEVAEQKSLDEGIILNRKK